MSDLSIDPGQATSAGTRASGHIKDRARPNAAQRRRNERTEFAVYLVLIFIAVLPLTTLTWVLQAARQLRLPRTGPVRRAYRQAQIIAPMIFSA